MVNEFLFSLSKLTADERKSLLNIFRATLFGAGKIDQQELISFYSKVVVRWPYKGRPTDEQSYRALNADQTLALSRHFQFYLVEKALLGK